MVRRGGGAVGPFPEELPVPVPVPVRGGLCYRAITLVGSAWEAGVLAGAGTDVGSRDLTPVFVFCRRMAE